MSPKINLKLVTASILSALTLTAVGCGSGVGPARPPASIPMPQLPGPTPIACAPIQRAIPFYGSNIKMDTVLLAGTIPTTIPDPNVSAGGSFGTVTVGNMPTSQAGTIAYYNVLSPLTDGQLSVQVKSGANQQKDIVGSLYIGPVLQTKILLEMSQPSPSLPPTDPNKVPTPGPTPAQVCVKGIALSLTLNQSSRITGRAYLYLDKGNLQGKSGYYIDF